MNEATFGKAYQRAWFGRPWPSHVRSMPTWRRETAMNIGDRMRRDTAALVAAVRAAQRLGGEGRRSAATRLGMAHEEAVE